MNQARHNGEHLPSQILGGRDMKICVPDYPWPYSEFEASLGYSACVSKPKSQRWIKLFSIQMITKQWSIVPLCIAAGFLHWNVRIRWFWRENSAACEPGTLESVLLLRGAAVGSGFVSAAERRKPSRTRNSITHGNHTWAYLKSELGLWGNGSGLRWFDLAMGLRSFWNVRC